MVGLECLCKDCLLPNQALLYLTWFNKSSCLAPYDLIDKAMAHDKEPLRSELGIHFKEMQFSVTGTFPPHGQQTPF